MTHRPHHSLFIRHRALPVFSALLCLLLQATIVGHMSLVEHTYCAAHGEFVHGGHGHDAHADNVPASPELGWQVTEQADKHEHCPVAQLQRAPTLPQPPVFLVLRPFLVANRATAPPVSESFVRSLPIWRSAPKTSPPA